MNYLSLNHIILSSPIHRLIIFLLPLSWSEYCLFFLFRVHCIAPGCSTFQKVSRSIDVTSVKDFANSIDALLVWQSFLFGNQLLYFKDHVYSKSNCWNEIRDVIFIFLLFFLSQASSIKDPTHVIQCNPLIVLYFEK
jgi:hypothetical protein